MNDPQRERAEEAPAIPERRRYNSPLRLQRAAETRARILAAGSVLVHGYPSWDWRNLTFRAVAEQAGVSERTVYRHFATEQQLHHAVMRRLEKEAGVTYEGLRLEDVAPIAGRVFATNPSFSIRPSQPDPPFAEEDRHRRHALLAAVSREAEEWSISDQEMAAAMLDVLWATPAYERLTTIWALDLEDATQAVTWVIALVREAIRLGDRPTSAHAPPRAQPNLKKSAKKRTGNNIKRAR